MRDRGELLTDARIVSAPDICLSWTQILAAIRNRFDAAVLPLSGSLARRGPLQCLRDARPGGARQFFDTLTGLAAPEFGPRNFLLQILSWAIVF